MSNLYLYLLGFGVLAYTLLRIIRPDLPSRKRFRLFYNTYNSGIALLTNGMLLKGILEIAGGTSRIIPWFFYFGFAPLATSAGLLVCAAGSRNTTDLLLQG